MTKNQNEQTMTINRESLTKLLDFYTYRLVDLREGKLTFDELKESLIDDEIIVSDEQMIKDAHDFAIDLYDDNNVTAPVIKQVLRTIDECTTNTFDDNNAAPNAIGELVYERLIDMNEDEQTAEKVSNAVFELTSDLVKAVGQYK